MKSRDLLTRVFEITEDPRDGLLFLKEFQSQKSCFSCLFISNQTLIEDFQKVFKDLLLLQNLDLFPLVVLHRSAFSYLNTFYAIENQYKKNQKPFPFFLIRNTDNLNHKAKLANSLHKTPILLSNWEEDKTESLLLQIHKDLSIQKFIFLEESPIQENGKTVSLLSPGFELETLKKSNAITEYEYNWLNLSEKVLSQVQDLRVNLVLTSPNLLLKELFTVKGSGTLIRKKSRIASYRLLSEVNKSNLENLMERAFRKSLKPNFWNRPFDLLLLEETYQGCAWLERTDYGFLLSKFAVDEIARGIGIGRDLWDEMVATIPKFFWRAKPNNPINRWYAKMADGQVKSQDWTFFWKGISVEEIPFVIGLLREKEEDFENNTA